MTNDRINTNKEQQNFLDGNNCHAYKLLGSKKCGDGARFCVWAPNADKCFVKFGTKTVEMSRDGEFFHISMEKGDFSGGYRYIIEKNGSVFEKNDPFAYSVNKNGFSEIASLEGIEPVRLKPDCKIMRIFEVHAGTYGKDFDSLAKTLPSYVKSLGFTHVELMPFFSHPCKESWGYQVTGFYSFEYGSAQSFSRLVNELHKEGIGVIADLPIGHFATDSFGLCRFDGTALYESEDKTLSENRLWGTINTDFEKPGVRSFMLSCACFLTDVFGIDGIRVDAVSNITFKRFDGYGSFGFDGDFSQSGIEFLRRLTGEMRKRGVITFSEDSSAQISSTAPAYLGGLGFDRKQNLGWYHDASVYFSAPPYIRNNIVNYLLKPFSYMNDESFVLPVSHDENTCGKGTTALRLKDEENQKLFLFYLYMSKGDKLLFDGCERGATKEWNPGAKDRGETVGIKGFVKRLNNLCDELLPLSGTCGKPFFRDGVLYFERFGDDEDDFITAVINTSKNDFNGFSVGVDRFADFHAVFSTHEFLEGAVYTPCARETDGRMFSVSVKLPPFSALILKPVYIWKQ